MLRALGAAPLRLPARPAHLLVVVLVALAFYARSIDNYWIKDDLGIGNFTDGENVTWEAIRPSMWPSHMKSEQYWRPIPLLPGWAEWAFWGANPAGYHLFNTLLHALVACLALMLANRLTKGAHPGVGLTAGLAVAINPVAPESVVWILQRMVLLCAAFSLLALLARLRAVESGGRRFHVAANLFLAGAILSKEIAVPLPACFFVIDWFGADPVARGSGRWRRALRGAVVPGLIVLAYMGCRYLLWGRVDIRYASLPLPEYARHNRVFELLGSSILNGILPVNAGIFGGGARFLLRAGIGLALLLALARGFVLLRESAVFRRLALIALALMLGSLLPTLFLFWIDDRLFNARFFYTPGLAILLFAAAALWLPRRMPAVAADREGSRVLPWAGTTLLLVSQGIALAGGLQAFDEGGDQVREIQLAALAFADRERRGGGEPVLVALMTPSQVRGVPTLEQSLALALKPPLAPRPGVDCIPLIDAWQNGPAWPKQLQEAIDARGIPLESLRYVECVFAPPGIRPLFGAPEPALGALPAAPVTPRDNWFTTNDPALAEPDFVFSADPSLQSFAIRFDSRDLAQPLRVRLAAGANLTRRADGAFAWRPSQGDARDPRAPNLWKDLVQASQPHPIALLWRVESFDEQDRLVGVSKTHRLLVFNVH